MRLQNASLVATSAEEVRGLIRLQHPFCLQTPHITSVQPHNDYDTTVSHTHIQMTYPLGSYDALELKLLILVVQRDRGRGLVGGTHLLEQVDHLGVEVRVLRERVEDKMLDAANLVPVEEVEPSGVDHDLDSGVEEVRPPS